MGKTLNPVSITYVSHKKRLGSSLILSHNVLSVCMSVCLYLRELCEVVLHGILRDPWHLLDIAVELLHLGLVALHLLVVQQLAGGGVLRKLKETGKILFIYLSHICLMGKPLVSAQAQMQTLPLAKFKAQSHF